MPGVGVCNVAFVVSLTAVRFARPLRSWFRVESTQTNLVSFRSLTVQENEIHYCAFTEELEAPYLVFMSTTTVFLPLAIMIVTYLKIFIETKKQAKKIADLESMGDLQRRHSILQQREAKAAKRIALILGLYMLCQLPISLLDFVTFTCDECVATAALTVAVALAYCNAISSPLVYAKADAEFRRTFKILLGKLRSKCMCKWSRTESTSHEIPVSVNLKTWGIPAREN